MDLNRRKDESLVDYHIRLLEGKLVTKELADVDYYELSKYLYGKPIASDNCRRMAYGSLRTVQLLKEAGLSDTAYRTEVSLGKDGTQTRSGLIAMSEAQTKDRNFLLEAHGYDPREFELVSAKNSIWNAPGKDGLLTLYSSKITVKPIQGINGYIVEEVFEKLKRDYVTPKKQYTNYERNGACFIVNYFDVHFAKLAHSEESGENYDYKIARQRLIDATQEYITRLQGIKLEKIIFAIGNDYFNSEFNGTTTAGTAQDNDSRYYKMFEKGIETLIEIIDMLSELAPVHVPLVQGNHDYYTSYSAARVLDAWYRNDENVTIDSAPTTRKYIKFGNDLFGFTHNADERDRIYNLMQIEEPKLWGETLYRTWFTGHKHSEDVVEKGGVIIRQAPSVCSSDAWHKRMGYVGAIKKTQAFIYDKEYGLTDILYVVVK